MTPFVLDASVAVKWFLPPQDEALIPEALSLLRLHDSGTIELIVPDLFWIECANVFQNAVRSKRWALETATGALHQILAYDLETVPSRPLIDRAFMIASTHNRALYDSIYVALAQEANCDMITADERLVNALGSRLPVRWLGAFRNF